MLFKQIFKCFIYKHSAFMCVIYNTFMQSIKKDQRSDIKNTLFVTLKTPGQSQVHEDNRNIHLLLKSSDIFFHLKHWTLTAYYI